METEKTHTLDELTGVDRALAEALLGRAGFDEDTAVATVLWGQELIDTTVAWILDALEEGPEEESSV